MKIVLAIAGSDPTGGAGLQADLQVIRHFGCHGMGVLTALTVQDTAKVHSVLPVFPSVVLDQLRCLVRDVSPHAVKIGMLASDDVVRNTALGLASVAADVPIVIDPILFARDGTPLLERRAWPALQSLFSRATLVTPNLPEAEDLLGRELRDDDDIREAARDLAAMGARNVVIKGGHREGDTVTDILFDGEAFHDFSGPRIETTSTHGTGCTFASAIATFLARGESVRDAVGHAKEYLTEALRRAYPIGGGHGPVHHFWAQWDER